MQKHAPKKISKTKDTDTHTHTNTRCNDQSNHTVPWYLCSKTHRGVYVAKHHYGSRDSPTPLRRPKERAVRGQEPAGVRVCGGGSGVKTKTKARHSLRKQHQHPIVPACFWPVFSFQCREPHNAPRKKIYSFFPDPLRLRGIRYTVDGVGCLSTTPPFLNPVTPGKKKEPRQKDNPKERRQHLSRRTR